MEPVNLESPVSELEQLSVAGCSDLGQSIECEVGPGAELPEERRPKIPLMFS